MKKIFLGKMNKLTASSLLIILSFYLIGCGSSITPISDRYKKAKDDTDSEGKAKEGVETVDEKAAEKRPELVIKHPDLNEDFDITPYKIKLENKNEQPEHIDVNNDVWIQFDKKEDEQANNPEAAQTDLGYRVQIMTTDSLEEANSVKAEVYFKVKVPVYVIYDSPYYKVRAGDYIEIEKARNLNFKLIQLGYKDSRIVQDSVNIVK